MSAYAGLAGVVRTLVGAFEPEPEEPVFGGILATYGVDTTSTWYGPEVTPYLATDRSITVPLTTSTLKPQERS